jgi:hypothetical protein
MAYIELPAVLLRSFRQTNGRAWRSIDLCTRTFHVIEAYDQPTVFETSFVPGCEVKWIDHDGTIYRPLLTNHLIPLETAWVSEFQLDDIIIRQSMNGRSGVDPWDAPHSDYPFRVDFSGHALADPWNRARSPGPLRRNGYWPEEVVKVTSSPMTFIEHEGFLLRPSSDLGWIVHLVDGEFEVTPWVGFEPAWVGPGVVFGASHFIQMKEVTSSLGRTASNTPHVEPLYPERLPAAFDHQGSADLATLRLVVHAMVAYHAPDLSDFEPEVAAWYWSSRACLAGRSELHPSYHLSEAVTVLAATRFKGLRDLSTLLEKRNYAVWHDPDLEAAIWSNGI